MLRTLAVGLAAVWILAGLKLAWLDRSVDLPTSSEDVLYVFPATNKFDCGKRCGGGGSRKETVDEDLNRTSPLRIIWRPRAPYTDAARAADLQGEVVLRVEFLKDCSIGEITVIKGLGLGLTDKAIQAARQITFGPKMVNGRTVNSTRIVEYSFHIY